MSQTIPNTHKIWRAVREDNLDYIKSQLSLQTASPNIVDKHGLTMAHYAVIYKRPRVFRFLIAVGTSTSSEDSSGLTPEAKVAQYCAWDLNLMAKYAVDLERTSEAFGFTELHASVIGLSPLPVLSTVKENRGLINKRDRAGMTPLHWAALRSDFEAQSILIAFGANSEAQDFAHKTPLHLACQNGASVQCLQGLLSAGTNVNSRDYYDNVPAYSLSQPTQLQLLLDNGTDLGHVNYRGSTLLHSAVLSDRKVKVAEVLLNAGVDVNAARKDGTVAVQLAVARRSTKALQLLIDHGARVDVTLRDSGYGILHLAGLYADPEMMRVLASADLRKVNPEARGRHNITPTDCFRYHRTASPQSPNVRAELEHEWCGLIESARRQYLTEESVVQQSRNSPVSLEEIFEDAQENL
ncbi:hypothetical protein KC354_g2501 [Hortaea werneckii]|nr:hypothetical protein KC354_g2501 [Hortaea werneckii]